MVLGSLLSPIVGRLSEALNLVISNRQIQCTGLVGTIILFMQIPYGLGKHADTIERPDYATFGKYSFIHTVVSLLGGIGLLKIAIALELIKYNVNSWRWYNITLWCLIGQPFSPTCRHNEVVD